MQSILENFGKRIGIESLDFESITDGVGMCSLSFDDIAVNVAYHEEERILYIHTAVASVPDNEKARLELYSLLLELNCGFRFTDGGILGVHDEYGIILSNKIRLENLDSAIFESFVERHVNSAEKIYTYLVESMGAMNMGCRRRRDAGRGKRYFAYDVYVYSYLVFCPCVVYYPYKLSENIVGIIDGMLFARI